MAITLKDIYDSIDKLREEIRDCYVTKEEFNPVKAVVYGLTSLILVAAVGAVIYLIATHPSSLAKF